MYAEREQLLVAADQCIRRQDYDDAFDLLARILNDDPGDLFVRLKVGDLCAKTKRIEEAVQQYEYAARRYQEQRQYLKAAAIYRQILSLTTPQTLPAEYSYIPRHQVQLCAHLELAADAIHACEFELQRLALARKRKEALTVLEDMIELAGGNPIVRTRVGEALFAFGEAERAVRSLSVALERFMQLGRVDEAIQVVERILHFKTDPERAVLAASLYLKKKSRQGAIRALQLLQVRFKQGDHDRDTLELLASAFDQLDRADKARAVRDEIAALPPPGTEKPPAPAPTASQSHVRQPAAEQPAARQPTPEQAESASNAPTAPPPPGSAYAKLPRDPALPTNLVTSSARFNALVRQADEYLRFMMLDEAEGVLFEAKKLNSGSDEVRARLYRLRELRSQDVQETEEQRPPSQSYTRPVTKEEPVAQLSEQVPDLDSSSDADVFAQAGNAPSEIPDADLPLPAFELEDELEDAIAALDIATSASNSKALG